MPKPRILIVDDEPGLLRLMELMLMSRYEVFTEADATLAFGAVVKFNPDLVILDWIMSMTPGGEVAELIRADPRVCETPIVFLSAFIMRRDEPQEIAGFPAIAKPFGVNELVETIEAQLSQVA